MRLWATFGAVFDVPRGSTMLWSPVALACGVGLYFSLRFEPGAGLLAALMLGCVISFGSSLALRSGFCLMPGLVAFGIVLSAVETRLVEAPVLEREYRGTISGRVVALDRSASNAVRVLLDQVELPRSRVVPERVRVSLSGYIAPGALEPGAMIMMRGWLAPPNAPVEPGGFDFRRHAWFQQIGAVGYTRDPVMVRAPPVALPLSVQVFRLRMFLSEWLRSRMDAETGAFAAAILTGDRSAIDPAQMADLRASNLAHLLAISGLHMGLLTGFVFGAVRLALALPPGFALRIPAKKIAAGVALAFGLFYLGLSGASVATQRAFIMAAVALIAVMLDRPVLTLRAVAIAALIVLVVHPVSLMGPGFQMSFAATTALVASFQLLRPTAFWKALGRGKLRYAKWFVVLAITSFVAGAATAPFSAYHFNAVGRYGYIANLLAVPAMGLIVVPGAMAALLLAPLGLATPALEAMSFGIKHILRIAHWAATREDALVFVPTGSPWILPLISLGALMLLLMKGRPRSIGLGPVLAALVLWSAPERPVLLVAENGRMFGMLTETGRALSADRGNQFAAKIWLENDGAPMDPKRAYLRDALQRTAKGRVEGMLPGNVPVLWTGADALTPDLCTQSAVLIAPKIERGTGGECTLLDQSVLAAGGAHALFRRKDGSLDLVSVADRSGVRPWTHRRNPF